MLGLKLSRLSLEICQDPARSRPCRSQLVKILLVSHACGMCCLALTWNPGSSCLRPRTHEACCYVVGAARRTVHRDPGQAMLCASVAARTSAVLAESEREANSYRLKCRIRLRLKRGSIIQPVNNGSTLSCVYALARRSQEARGVSARLEAQRALLWKKPSFQLILTRTLTCSSVQKHSMLRNLSEKDPRSLGAPFQLRSNSTSTSRRRRSLS